jgi:hypothetical protein
MKLGKWIMFVTPIMGLGMQFAVMASDHDDGETDIKGRSLNLTDLYAFREDWQTGNAGDRGNMILVMNTNPRSLPRQQYYFSTTARYELHLGRAGTDNAGPASTKDDVVLRFEFGRPDANNVQSITVTALKAGKRIGEDDSGATTPLGTQVLNNSMNVGGCGMTVFAGLREDPFFFDVEGYFKFRAAAASGAGAAASLANFTNPGSDFTTGYNVNSIVARVPIRCLQAASDTVFDIWETISIPK